MGVLELFQVVGIGFLGLMLFLALFEPTLAYRIRRAPSQELDSAGFRRMLAALSGSDVRADTRVEVLTDGPSFYEAEIAAMRAARHSINLEAYIFHEGELTRRILEVLLERARAGVQVKLVVDSIGSFFTRNRYFRDLRAAGGRVAWYHPLRWYTLPRINNRTHREILVIDGTTGFVGGAGFADHWYRDHGRRGQKKRWRDTMVRVEGEAVRDLQSTFAENWLETSGEVLADQGYFPPCEAGSGGVPAMVVASSPSTGRGTRNRMLYQTLLACAQKTIWIACPYFLPDKSARGELVRAIRDRGVDVRIILPGKHTDHLLTRRSSRRLWGQLLRAGARIYEYQAAMLHAKVMIIDGVWSVVGSTNFDHRSFGINDEVNLAVYDGGLAERLQEDFLRDVALSERVRYREWRSRPLLERGHECLGWLLERQQ